MSTLPAAAIPVGSKVLIDGEIEMTIFEVLNATPQAGTITWLDKKDNLVQVKGSEQIEVISLPSKDGSSA